MSPAATNRRDWVAEGVLGLLLIICCLMFVRHYVSIEHPAYIWDWGGYYDIYRRYSRLLIENAAAFRISMLASVASDNYNPSAVAAIMPVALIFGEGRSPFVAAIVVLYLVPACLIMGALARLALSESGVSTSGLASCLILFASVAYFPIWPSALRGMPDSVALVPLGLATLLLLRTRFLRRATILQAVWLGLLIWFAFLFRRWYAFSCIGLLSASMTFCALTVLTDLNRIRRHERADRIERNDDPAKLPVPTRNVGIVSVTVGASPLVSLVRAAVLYAIAGCVVTACLAIFQRPLALEILRTSYADLYAGYQSDFAGQMKILRYRLGDAMLLLFVSGLVLALVARNTTILFCSLAALISHALFMRTQAPSIQHTLPLFYWIFPTVIFAIMRLYERLPRFTKPFYALVVGAIFAVGFLGSFLPGARAHLAPLAKLYPTVPTLPLHLENIDEYRRMAADVQALADPAERIGVLASSEVLTPNLLRIFAPSLETRIEPTSNVDLVEGLDLASLRARYAVVTTPVTLHMKPEFQRVVAIPAEGITERVGFGSAYTRIAGPYQLGSVEAFLFRRDRPLGAADIAELERSLQRFYPDWRWDGGDRIYRPDAP